MSSSKYIIKRNHLVTVTIFASILMIFYYSENGTGEHKHVIQGKGLETETSFPVKMDFYKTCPWYGKVENKKVIKIISLSAGRIISIKPEDNRRVKRGEILFKLGGLIIAGRIQVLKDKIKHLNKRIVLAHQTVDIKNYEVTNRIAKKDELISEKKILVDLKSRLHIKVHELNTLENFLTVSAPIDGFFTDRQVSIGQDVAKGTWLATLISNDVRIAATIFPPEDIALEGKRVIIDKSGNKQLCGTIVSVLPQTTPDGATQLWIECSKINKQLKAGELLGGKVVLLARKGSLAVPESAIMRDEQEQTLVFLKSHNDYYMQPVVTGLDSKGWVEIVSGISKGDNIVIRGGYELLYRNFNKAYNVED